MKNKANLRLSSQHRKGQCFITAVMAIAIFFFYTNCGVKSEFLPKRNVMICKLFETSKSDPAANVAMDDYISLTVLLDDNGKEKVEQKINTIKTVKDLIEFIEMHLIYQKLYDAWLQTVPTSRSTGLKNEIKNCTNQDKVDELIQANLPKALQEQLSDVTTRSNLKILAPKEIKEVLKLAKEKETAGAGTTDHLSMSTSESLKSTSESLKSTSESLMSTSESLMSTSESLKQLIDQKAKEKEADGTTETNRKDDWGKKLPLFGEKRKQFLKLVMQFSNSDQKQLKALFHKAEVDSIENFLDVYSNDKVFALNERIDLLGTLIYLYKSKQNLCMKMCNNPESLGRFDEIRIFNICSENQLTLLTKFREACSE